MDVLAVCMIIGTLILFIGIGFLTNRIIFIKQAKLIKGKVIRIKEDYIDNKKSFFPVIEYLDERGKRSVFESSAGSYRSSKYRVNDVINLRYRRVGKKNKVCENSIFALFGIALLFIPIGLLFSVIGVLGMAGVTLEMVIGFFA